jgi:hypothetical protein
MTAMQKVFWLIISLGNFLSIALFSQQQSLLSVLFLIFTLAYSAVGFYDVFL